MKNISVIEGILVAALLSCATFGSGVFGGAFFLYLLYIVARSKEAKAKLLLATLGSALTIANILLSTSYLTMLSHGALIIGVWRWLLTSRTLISLALEGALYFISMGAAYWVWFYTGSKTLVIWSFFLVQSLHVFIPKKLEERTVRSTATSEFHKSYETAVRALSRMMA